MHFLFDHLKKLHMIKRGLTPLVIFLMFAFVNSAWGNDKNRLQLKSRAYSTTLIDTIPRFTFLKKRFNYLYKKFYRFRFGYGLTIENYDLKHGGELRHIPMIRSSTYTFAIDCSGSTKSLIFPTLYFSYQKSLHRVSLMEEYFNLITMGITLVNLKLLNYKLDLEAFTDLSLFAWAKSIDTSHTMTFGITARYNFYNNVSLECSVFRRDGCEKPIANCSENSFNFKSPGLSLSLVLNI